MNVCSSVIVILGLGFGSGWTATALPQSMPAAPQAVEACPRIEGVEVLVSAQRAELVDAAFELVAFLPRTGTAYLGAERALARVEREHGDAVRIVALVPDGCRELVELRARGPRGGYARLLDVGDRNRARFADWLNESVGAQFVLMTAAREVVHCGRLESELRHDVADARAGRLPLAATRTSGATIGNRAGGSGARLPSLDEVRHEPWVAAIRSGVGGDRRATLRAALRALRDRPEFQARVIEVAAQRDADALAGEFGRRAIGAMLRAEPRSPLVQRAAFVGFAALGDARAAQGAAFAWIESCKGLPGRAEEILAAIDDAPGGAARFAGVVDRVLDVALLAEPNEPQLLRRAFEHAAELRRDVVQARRYGAAWIAGLDDDAQALNSLAWRLLTSEPYAGEFPELALAAARAMQDAPGWETYWRVDTLALACFENGLVEEAVEWQRRAVAECDPSARHRYEARLARYEEALGDRR